MRTKKQTQPKQGKRAARATETSCFFSQLPPLSFSSFLLLSISTIHLFLSFILLPPKAHPQPPSPLLSTLPPQHHLGQVKDTSKMATIPLGLGLATASHLYLCHRNLLQAERERQYHVELSERCELDLLFHSLSGKALFSELIDLLDSTLAFHSDSNGNRSNDDGFGSKSCAGSMKKRRSSRPSPRHRRYQLQQEQQEWEQQEQLAQRSWPLLLSSPTVKIAEGTGATSGERDTNAIDIDKQQQQPQLQPQPQQQQNTSRDPSSRDRTSRNARAAVASSQYQPPPSPLPSSQNQALLHGTYSHAFMLFIFLRTKERTQMLNPKVHNRNAQQH